MYNTDLIDKSVSPSAVKDDFCVSSIPFHIKPSYFHTSDWTAYSN